MPTRPQHVYFFSTCLVDLFVPQAGMDAIRLLEREGIRVTFPEDQTCCGQPAYSSGHEAQARTVALQQLKLFPENWPIIVPSGSCAAMMRHDYPLLFANDPALLQQAKAVASRVYELSEFLVDVLGFARPDTGPAATVALHTSCAARRGTGALNATRSLLGQMAQVDLQIHDHESECCGFGGMFSVLHPDIAGAMVSDKLAAIAATGAKQFITGDCGCMLNIAGHAEKCGTDICGEHFASFLWRRTQGSNTSEGEK